MSRAASYVPPPAYHFIVSSGYVGPALIEWFAMNRSDPSEITQLLHAWNDGNEEAQEELWSILYSELKVIARSALRQRGGQHQTASLVNQASTELKGSP